MWTPWFPAPTVATILDRGVAEVAADRYPGVTVEVEVELVDGFAELRRRLEAGGRPSADVVILSVDDEVRRLGSRSTVRRHRRCRR